MVKIKEIMREYVITADSKVSLASAAKIMAKNKVGSILIVDNGKPVGIVTADDVTKVVANGKSPQRVKLADFKKKLISVSPDDDVVKTTRLMIKNGVKRMPVLKEGRLIGIVTDKEILLSVPEMVDVLSERLKARIERVAPVEDERISGLCERCETYSDELKNVGGKWYCEDCRNTEGDE